MFKCKLMLFRCTIGMFKYSMCVPVSLPEMLFLRFNFKKWQLGSLVWKRDSGSSTFCCIFFCHASGFLRIY